MNMEKPPVATRAVILILLVALVITALVAGYYYSLATQEKKINTQLKETVRTTNSNNTNYQ